MRQEVILSCWTLELEINVFELLCTQRSNENDMMGRVQKKNNNVDPTEWDQFVNMDGATERLAALAMNKARGFGSGAEAGGVCCPVCAYAMSSRFT